MKENKLWLNLPLRCCLSANMQFVWARYGATASREQAVGRPVADRGQDW